MLKRIIEISSGPARLSIAHRQLVIEREGQTRATVPAEDVGVLIVDNPAVAYSHSVFTTLLDLGAAIVLCGGDHHPAGLLLPLAGNAVQSERFQAQIIASAPLKKRLWQATIMAKIRQQSLVLQDATKSDNGLRALAARVRSGDPDNLEAQAAQRYWRPLLGAAFRRDRAGPPPNNLLNYGYMVLRAGMARAVVGAGLIATLGIHHRNRSNAFCLADDLMEPYRPYVDWRVRRMVAEGEAAETIERQHKQALLSLFNETILVGGRRSPLLLAMHATAAALRRSFEDGKAELALPKGLPIRPELEDGDGPSETSGGTGPDDDTLRMADHVGHHDV